ncbi:MAG: hypothetical protein FGM24_08040 [Candidatus Kapabacteria bacterium]|nr:hypothetical protein [Candidatus Kapabacteria bacterium]
MSKSTIIIAIGACVALMLPACEQSKPDPNIETAKTGAVTILVDREILDLVTPSVDLFRKQHPYATIKLQAVTAREATSALFAQEAKGVIVARDYLPDEANILKERQQDFPRTHIATDALVLFTSKAYPADTVSADDVRAHLMGQRSSLGNTTFVTTGASGSLVGNVINMICGGSTPTANLSELPDVQAVRQRVVASSSLIGIGYLSQLRSANDVKLLRVGFTDTTGKRIYPKPVHQAYIVQGKYPYPVPIYTCLRDRPSMYNLASGLFGFVYQEKQAQQTFLNAGIVPEFAKIVLVPEGQD